MAGVKRNCIFCGRDTTAKAQICYRCLGLGFCSPKDFASATAGPNDLLLHEFDHDYTEDALGPHGSDQRWGYKYVED